MDVSIGDIGVAVAEIGRAGPKGETGPAGLPGAPGGDPGLVTLDGTAGENLSGHRAVYLSQGSFFYADKDSEEKMMSVAGVTTGAVLSGGNIQAISLGVISEPSWTWTYPAPVFIGNNGQLVQARPTVGFLVQIGSAFSPDSILVKIGRTIKLA